MATIMRVGGGAGGGAKTKTIASLNVGDIVQMRENGTFAQYRIVHKGLPSAMYDASCDGVWLMREKLYETRQWDSADNSYKDSGVHERLSTFADMFTPDAKNLIKTVKIPYISGKGNSPVASGANGLETKVFLLGAYEVGFTKSTNSGITEDGACLNYFSGAGNSKRIAYLNGTATKWWLRSSFTAYEAYSWLVGVDGSCSYDGILNVYGIRPAFVLSNGAEITNEPNSDGSYSLLCDAVLDKVGRLATGDIIRITENGIPAEYYVAKHGYEAELNGANRTLLVRKDLHSLRAMHSSSVNAYATSTMDAWLNGDFYNSLSAGVQELIGSTTFQYTPGNGNKTVTTLERAVFLLSLCEIGLTDGNANNEGSVLPIANALKVAYLNGSAAIWWVRTPVNSNKTSFFNSYSSGLANANEATYTNAASRPAFTIPSNAKVIGPDNTGRYSLEVETVSDVYGIARDITASSPEWVRTDGAMTFSAKASIGTVAGASDFDNIYPWSEMKRVTLDTGDVMVRIPKFYYGRYRNGNIERIQISGRADVGLTLHPAFNHGGVEQDCIYVGAYKTSGNNKSVSGASPQANQTRATFRTNARAKGDGWHLFDISTLSAIQMLYLVEFANNNSQQMIGRGYVDGNSAAINTGSCDTVPNLTGRPAGTDGKTDIVYRGIEGIWGNIWEFVDGINWNGSIYVCNNPSQYADNTSTNYSLLSYTGGTNWNNAYIKEMGVDTNGNPFVMFPSVTSASENTYYCDQAFTTTGWRVMRHGCNWDALSGSGLFAVSVQTDSGGSGTHLGSRLIYIP